MYPQTIVGEAGLAVWMQRLKDIPGKELTLIVAEWVDNETRSPTVADIRSRASAVAGTGPEEDWKTVMYTVTNGRFRDRTKMGAPPLERGFMGNDALEDAVAEAGGWLALARSDVDELVWRKKSFMAAYREARATHDTRTALALDAASRKELTDGSY
jgi:hypothetical protein